LQRPFLGCPVQWDRLSVSRAPISSVSRYPKNVVGRCGPEEEVEQSRVDRGGKKLVTAVEGVTWVVKKGTDRSVHYEAF
jgi:hypothetical protein